MKQNIECPKCAARWLPLLGKGVAVEEKAGGRTELVKHYPDTGREVVTIQTGTARKNMWCDNCNGRIQPGDECSAVGVYAPDAGTHDIPGWAEQFINLPASWPPDAE